MGTNDELWRRTACEAVRLLEAGEVSPDDLIDSALKRIEDVNGKVNAVCSLCEEQARKAARQLGQASSDRRNEKRPWLAGLPVLIKDLTETAGVRTTYGSPIFSDFVPKQSGVEVLRIERHGGIVLGKTNSPEFGAGANTFNEVFGATLNPWNTDLTCGGSSGGSAVALASGMAWLAHGSDLGGSLRTPASFCSVVGLRPSAGRVPKGPSSDRFNTLGVSGPMARNVPDLALFMDVMAGFEPDDPLSFESESDSFTAAARAPTLPECLAYSADLDGITPIDAEIASVCQQALQTLSGHNVRVVEDRCPDLSQAVAVFEILRASSFAAGLGPLLDSHRDQLKPEVIWNIERGLALTGDEIGWAERERSLMQQRVCEFFGKHDLLLCPTAIVPPFDVRIRYLEKLGEHRFPSYIDWVSIAYAITLTGCPALSLPCGFTREGLPVGLQIVGPPRGEARVIAAAAAMEEIFGLAGRVPMDPVLGSVAQSGREVSG